MMGNHTKTTNNYRRYKEWHLNLYFDSLVYSDELPLGAHMFMPTLLASNTSYLFFGLRIDFREEPSQEEVDRRRTQVQECLKEAGINVTSFKYAESLHAHIDMQSETVLQEGFLDDDQTDTSQTDTSQRKT